MSFRWETFGDVKGKGNMKVNISGANNRGTVFGNMDGNVNASNCTLDIADNMRIQANVSNSNIVANGNMNLTVHGEGHNLQVKNTMGVTLAKEDVMGRNKIEIRNIQNWFSWLPATPWTGARKGNRNFEVHVAYSDEARIDENVFKLGIFVAHVEKPNPAARVVRVEIDQTGFDEGLNVETGSTSAVLLRGKKQGVEQFLKLSGPNGMIPVETENGYAFDVVL